jgi:exopolysaccharide biosynthesis polyprenyl glycosylphosphotransferase
MISENRQRALYIAGDLLATVSAWLVFSYIRFVMVGESENYSSFASFLGIRPVILGLILFPLGMSGLYWLSGYYNKVFIKSRIEELTTTLSTAFVGTIAIYFLAIVDDPIPDRATNYELLVMLFGLLFTFVYLERLTFTTLNSRRVASGKIAFNTVYVGSLADVPGAIHRLESGINHLSHAFRVVGILEWISPTDKSRAPESGKSEIAGLPVLSLNDMESFCRANDVRTIVVARSDCSPGELLELINKLLPLEIPVLMSPSLVNLLTAKPRLNRLVADPFIDITTPYIAESTINMKRAGDFIGALIAAILLIPTYLVIAIAVKLDSKGPVIYTQKRIGLHRKPFYILKFRTMTVDAEASGPRLSSENDPRITRVGRFLRKYRLDELPQFINVIAGNMSLVGPRPERDHYIQQILENAPYYTLLHCVRPGITSLGMVKHGYASSIDEMIQRMHYDLIYIENVSFTTDLKIIAYTIATVMSGKGK